MRKSILVTLQIITGVVVAGLITAAIIAYLRESELEKNDFEEASKLNEITSEYVEIDEENPQNSKVDFGSLAQTNLDLVAWLYDGNAGINQPVVQTANNEYYLNRSFLRESSRLGTVFLDYRLDIASSDFLILYGHNMGKNRTEMFSPLAYYDKHREDIKDIIMILPGGTVSRWEVFSVCIAQAGKGAEDLYVTQGFADETDFDEFIGNIKQMQLYDTGNYPQFGSRILMLSTCTGDMSQNRDIRRMVFAAEVEN